MVPAVGTTVFKRGDDTGLTSGTVSATSVSYTTNNILHTDFFSSSYSSAGGTAGEWYFGYIMVMRIFLELYCVRFICCVCLQISEYQRGAGRYELLTLIREEGANK
jgi:hypothetical protein